MQKFTLGMVLLLLSVFGPIRLTAQTTILDETLLNQTSFNTFTTVSVTGSQSWNASTTYGAVCSGYSGGQNFENEDWLISPIVNLAQTDNVNLSFNHTRGNAAVMNVGLTQGWYSVYATANYTGDPATTNWIALEGLNQNIPAAWQYVASGALVIPDVAKSENSRIAFRYKSSAMQSATWEIKNVKILGDPQPTNPNAGIFKLTNWNTEWLGCTLFGPADENLQLANVVAAMRAMNADLYCLQEVSNTISNPTIATLVSLLGTEQWEGRIVPSATDDCDQRQGIIYKKSKVQFVNATQLSTGNAAQGNSYYYNWASGRYPALYNINVVAGNSLVPLSIVNIHAKAEDGNAMSYTRRLGASEALKTILDGVNYNTKNLVLVGDFNDYLIGTTSNTCDCTASPYQNFMDDDNHYNGVTKTIIDANYTWGTHPLIEHMVISDELFANYLSDNAAQELAVYQNTDNYFNTTSNHLPVSARFQFDVLGNQQFATQTNSWAVYPNPVKDALTFDRTVVEQTAAAVIYDLMGRTMRCDEISENAVNVSSLPAGIYVLSVGEKRAKFVKE